MVKQPDIPWEKINGMRNVLGHHYFGIDTEIVWEVLEKELPDLKKAIVEIVERNKPKGEACQSPAQGPEVRYASRSTPALPDRIERLRQSVQLFRIHDGFPHRFGCAALATATAWP